MKLAKDDLVAALRLRYDHYSAQTMFEVARAHAGLAEQAAYDAADVAAFRAALGRVGDRVTAVEDHLAAWLEEQAASPARPAPAPAVQPDRNEPAKDAAKEPAKDAAKEPAKAPKNAPKEPAKDAAKSTKKTGEAAAKDAAVETVVALSGVEAGEGAVVLMCGGSEELGDWDPARARPMSRAGDRWIATLALAPDTNAAFKFVVRTPDGGVVWEKGDDRYLVATAKIDATWR